MVDGKIAALDTPSALKITYSSLNMNDVFLKLARAKTVA
jgi:ABC-2 type transport system ATP-binding protein